MVIIPKITITTHEILSFTEGTNLRMRSPAHESGTPGNIGATVPTAPTIRQITARAINKGSGMGYSFSS